MERVSTYESEQKNILWQKEKEIVDKITDRLGLEIDGGIKDTVIALRLLGINTTSSHEGKIDRYPVAYVDIESPQAHILSEKRSEKIGELTSAEEKDLREAINSLWDEIQVSENEDEEKALRVKAEELEKKLSNFEYPESQEIIDLDEKIEIENLKEQKKIEVLLKLFYKDRDVDDESNLVLNMLGSGCVRLQSRAAEIQENETDEEKKKLRLQRFQQEMADFTDFLKEMFFNS